LIVVDEAQHATASTYRKIIEHFNARIVGVTATPDRGDGHGLRGMFQTVAYEMGIVRGVAEGWLVPLMGQRRYIDNIHLEKIKKVAGDLALGALDNEIVNSKVAIARDLVAQLQGKHTIVFTPGVESAKLISAALNELIPDCAREVDGSTNEDERRESFSMFRKGSLNYLVNCAIATEGVDLPVADVIAMCRPTLSRALYTQMVGRGLRPLVDDLEGLDLPEERRLAIARSRKPDCLILDYVGNSGKHDLVGPEDILGADESDEVLIAAKKIAKEKSRAGERVDIQEAIRLAKKAAAELADRHIEAEVKFHGFDPLAAFGLRSRQRPDMDQRAEPPTPAQLAALMKWKLKESELRGLTKRSAAALMDKLIERGRLGLCSPGQMRALTKFTDIPRADLANVSFPLASAMIDRIARSSWKRGWTREELFPKEDFVY
jgi:superfamily II DNA or RNA helicase